jgi:hypothetical protein
MKITDFWVVVTSSLVEVYRRFRGASFITLPDYGSNKQKAPLKHLQSINHPQKVN